jgi:hypothetical protein
MADFGRRTPDGRDPSLDAIARTDRLLDALAAERPVASNDPADLALASLLEGWRDELRWPPATGLVSERDAVSALHEGLAARQRPPRRGPAIVGAVAAAILCLGGFGALIAGAHPGDALYGLRAALFGEPQSVRDDRIVLAAQTELNQVQDLIKEGDWEQAQAKLAAATTAVQTVNDVDRKQDLVQEYNRLSVQVVNRDPNATVPPDVPSTELLTPPVNSVTIPVAPPPELTTTPTTTPTTETSTPTTSPSPSTDTTTSSQASSTTTTTTTSPAPATSTQPTTTTAVTTSPPTSQPRVVTTTTTAAPVTPTTTTVAPALAPPPSSTTSTGTAVPPAVAGTTTATTSTARQAAGTTPPATATTSTASQAAGTTTPATATPPTAATTVPTTTAAPATGEPPARIAPPSAVTTTTVVPYPGTQGPGPPGVH